MSAIKEIFEEAVEVGNQGWQKENWRKLGQFFGGDGFNIGGKVSSDHKAWLREGEERMVEDINKLTIDPETGLPVLKNLVEESEAARLDKEGAIETIGREASDIKGKTFADLYKSGATTHGKTESILRQTGQDFQNKVGTTMRDYAATTGGIEEQAKTDLEEIRASIAAAKTRFSKTGGVRGEPEYFKKRRYDTSLTPGVKETAPLEVKEEMYEYDYVTGLKQKKPDTV